MSRHLGVTRLTLAVALLVFGGLAADAETPTGKVRQSVARGGLNALFQLPDEVKPALPQTAGTRSCDSIQANRLGRSAVVREARTTSGANGQQWCKLTVELSQTDGAETVTVLVGLPLEHWNGRFLGLGGGGFVAGFPAAVVEGVNRGFAVAVTNAGRAYDFDADPSEIARVSMKSQFLIGADGKLDWVKLQDFAYRSIHDMTVIGKEAATEFYSVKPRYAYFSGCSTGGRQGQSEVQRYPDDYNGVMSGSPAINWAHFVAADTWQGAVTNQHHLVPQCKFDVAQRAALDACDADDGARDGLISTFNTCHFDARRLIGKTTECGAIDNEDAAVIASVWEGPTRRDGSSLWSGVDRAALIHPLFEPQEPLPFGEARLAHPANLSVADFESQFDEFVERYGGVMDTSNPDIAEFAKRGGKTILWHGISDDTIAVAGTVHYVDAIRRVIGARAAEETLRLYLAPGVGHCSGGGGPQPVGLLSALMGWVERGVAPSALRSENWNEDGATTRTRPLCSYPEYARYRGRGSLNEASSFACHRVEQAE